MFNFQNTICWSLLLVFVFLTKNQLSAQQYTLVKDSTESINVTGTSTLHGWTVVVKEVTNLPDPLILVDNDSILIDSFSFAVVIASMDGGRGASMNKKITTALQAADHPIIRYQQTQPAIIQQDEITDDGHFKVLSKGVLSMVGLEKAITIEVIGHRTPSGITLSGSKPLKFSDFEIEPPSAMFGQIVCGDDISVNFKFNYLILL